MSDEDTKPPAKKPRAAPAAAFIESEKMYIAEMYKANFKIFTGAFGADLTFKDKQAKWNEIAVGCNNLYPQGNRTADSVCKKWKNMTTETRRKLSIMKYPPTGGGKPPAPLTAVEEFIADIFDKSSSWNGIGGVSSENIAKTENTAEEVFVATPTVPKVIDTSVSEMSESDLSDVKSADSFINRPKRISPKKSDMSHRYRSSEKKEETELQSLQVEVLKLEKEKLKWEIDKYKYEVFFLKQRYESSFPSGSSGSFATFNYQQM